MKILFTLLLGSFLVVTACTFERKLTGTVSRGGYDFPFERTSTDDAFYDSEDDIVYRVTFPDGSTATFGHTDDSYRARRDMHKGIDTWLRNNTKSAPATAIDTSKRTGTDASSAKGDPDESRGD
ncbi:hypothetical protein AAFO92_11395 [Roseovarius sp. CAU 1744]|uniref:hypothetical protein n=1 Tax=Roseovarius sp. CAU 1744 TaxID=3140368 RepID=UPI00325BACD0